MKLNNLSSQIHFCGKIIDAHAHIGKWQDGGNLRTFTIDQLDTFTKEPIKASGGDVVDKMLVSSLDCLSSAGQTDEYSANKKLIDSIKGRPQYAAIASCDPKGGSVENIKRLFDENPNSFLGLKFHPSGGGYFASDKALDPYLKFAQERKLPCLFHCEIPWKRVEAEKGIEKYVLENEPEKMPSSPQEIYKAAKKVPDTPVIMAHLGSGGRPAHEIAIKTLLDSIDKGEALLYADISWVDCDKGLEHKPTIIDLIRKLKNHKKGDMTSRLLFGSDAPLGSFASAQNGANVYGQSVADIKSAIKKNFEKDADDLIDKIFYRNAHELFFKSQQIQNQNGNSPISQGVKSTAKKISKTTLGLIIGLGVAIIAGDAYLLHNKKSAQKISNKAQLVG